MSSKSEWTIKSFLTSIGVDESDVDDAAAALMAAGYKKKNYFLSATRESLEKSKIAFAIIDVILNFQATEAAKASGDGQEPRQQQV